MTRRRVGVLLDFGAATPMGVLAAARGLCDVVFLCDRDLPYVRGLVEELSELSEVCDITGRTGPAVRRQIAQLRLDGLTTFSEAQIRRTAEFAENTTMAYLSPLAARAVTDKYAQRRLLAAAGLPATVCQAVSDPAHLPAALAATGLPAVLKPRSGAGSAHTCRVDTVTEAARRFDEFQAELGRPGAHFVVEEYLRGDPLAAGPGWGDYVSVESVTVCGTVRHVEVTGKLPLAPPFRETGYVIPSTLTPQLRQAVLEVAGYAIRALGIRHGLTHVELKLTPAGPRVIEVNGRLGGYVADLLRRSRGTDLIRLALAAALGQSLDLTDTGYRRCAFQYFLTPPMHAVVLRRLDGIDELRRQPGIQHVELFRQVGDPVDWRQGTLAYLGIVHGAAPSHEGVLALVATVHRTLRIGYEYAIAEPGGD